MEQMNLKWALYWASHGWKLFPSYWQEGHHQPLTLWKTLTSDNPGVLKQWALKWPGCYFCVAVKQSGLTLLDIDTKHGKNGPGELKSLELIYGPLPTTLEVSTPSGGLHYWFSGMSTQTIGKLGPGIDTPVMAPVPGTVIPEKGTYLIRED